MQKNKGYILQSLNSCCVIAAEISWFLALARSFSQTITFCRLFVKALLFSAIRRLRFLRLLTCHFLISLFNFFFFFLMRIRQDVYLNLLQCCVFFNLLRMSTIPLVSLCAVFPGRLCAGPSSPCRPQATSCWDRPATSSSCWRTRSKWRRAWRCHRKAGSGSCRACCWEK